MRKIKFKYLLLLPFLVLLTGCQKDVSLGENPSTIKVNESFTVDVVNADEFNVGVDSEYFTVQGHTLTAIKAGVTTVVVSLKDMDLDLMFDITIINQYQVEVEEGIEIEVGNIYTPNVVVSPISEYSLKTKSKNVLIEGKEIKGLNVGKATIDVVVDGAVIESFTVKVIKKIINVEIENLITELTVGQRYEVIATVTDDLEYVLATSTPDVIEINAYSIIAKNVGVAEVNILVEGEVRKSIYIDIKEVVYTITVEDKLTTMNIGDHYSPVVTVTPYARYKIYATPEEIVEVSDNTIKALGAGVITVTVIAQNAIYKFDIVVESQVNRTEEILTWALDQVGSEGYSTVKLPTTHPQYGGDITWEASQYVNTTNGDIEFIEFDKVIKLTCNVAQFNYHATKTIDYTVIGYALCDISDEITSHIRPVITGDLNLVTSLDYYGGTSIVWSSSNTDYFTNDGRYTKPMSEKEITLEYTITTKDPHYERTFKKECRVIGYSFDERLEMVKEYIYQNVLNNMTITKETVLPTELKQYEATIEWLHTNYEVIDLNNLPVTSSLGGGSYIIIKVYMNKSSKEISAYVNFWQEDFSDIWQTAEMFVATIAEKTIATHKFNLYGYEKGYETVPTENIGYLPFYDHENAKIIQAIVDPGISWVRSNTLKKSTEYIVVHNTGGASPTSTAKQLSRYINTMSESEGPKSWHFTIDDKEIYQQLPLDEVGWHAGDGSTEFPGTWSGGLSGGNRNGIGIETCGYKGIDFNDAMRNLAKVIAELLIEYNLGFDRIKQHYDFSGKNCPQVIRESNRWNELLHLVQIEYFAKVYLKGVTFEWKSLTPNVMDDRGRIINHTGEGTVVKYQVTVKYQNESRVFTHESVLEARK